MHNFIFKTGLDHIREFDINYASLKEGIYNYRYKIDKRFFGLFSDSELSDADINVDIVLEKKSRLLILNFIISGTVKVICDRCLEYFDMPVSSTNDLYVKFGDENCELTEDMVIMSHAEYRINVAQYIYEYINLSVPMKRIHDPDSESGIRCKERLLCIMNKLEHDMKEKDNGNAIWSELKKIKK